MKYPTCGENTPDDWKRLIVQQHFRGPADYYLEAPQEHARVVQLDWMRCAAEECRELVVRVHESYPSGTTHHADGRVTPTLQHTATWYARPRTAQRLVDPLVPDPFRTDYLEAAAILDLSPRMSAVLSRRVLADLLGKYANHSQFKLSERIDKFTEDNSNPSGLRDNLHHFREIADFGAHTQKDDQAEVITITREEAEWTLDLLDRLFDHFIVTPEKDRRMRESMDAKLKAAGRRPILRKKESE
jgi:hypothetical protein